MINVLDDYKDKFGNSVLPFDLLSEEYVHSKALQGVEILKKYKITKHQLENYLAKFKRLDVDRVDRSNFSSLSVLEDYYQNHGGSMKSETRQYLENVEKNDDDPTKDWQDIMISWSPWVTELWADIGYAVWWIFRSETVMNKILKEYN